MHQETWGRDSNRDSNRDLGGQGNEGRQPGSRRTLAAAAGERGAADPDPAASRGTAGPADHGQADRGSDPDGAGGERGAWSRVRADLRRSIGRHNFDYWIAPIRLLGMNGALAQLAVSSAFNGNWVERHYGEQLLAGLRRHRGEVSGLEFVVAPGPGAAASDPAAPAGAPQSRAAAAPARDGGRPDADAGHDMGHDTGRGEGNGGDAISAPLDPKFRFESFVVGKPNELAHAAARRVAEGGPVSYSPLFLHGGVGLGKTHLMHAIAWELRLRFPDKKVAYLSADKFMNRFVQALRERTMMEFKQLFRGVDVLMVDDVQFIAGKESTQEEFFHTFNALIEENKQIILSADRAPGEIKDLEERISSRLASGLVVDLHPTTYELRLGILEQKAGYYLQQYPGVTIAPGVLEFLAHRISTNVRVLEGALLRLFAFASLVRHQITLELVHDCLADVLRSAERRVTVDEIQRKVAEHYAIRLSDLVGPRRNRPLARPRQVAMYLSKQLTTRSLPEIGRRFGGRDHTTVMHGIRRIEALMATDAQLADDLALLRRALEG